MHYYRLSLISSLAYYDLSLVPPSTSAQVKLSEEHQGFIFESDAKKSINMLEWHSGGKVSMALQKAIDRNEIVSVGNRDMNITNKCSTNTRS